MYYDGPLLFWLPCDGRRLLAMAILGSEYRYPFLVLELSDAQVLALESNQLSLRAASLEAQATWVIPDYDAEELALVPLAAIPDEWLAGDVFLKPKASA